MSVPHFPGHGERPRCTTCSDSGFLPAMPGQPRFDYLPCPCCSQALVTWVPADGDELVDLAALTRVPPCVN